METSKQQTLPFGEIESMCCRADSPVNRSARRGKEKARKTTATSGPKCSELFDLFDPVGSWGENVLGIVNWSEGLVFEQVCSDLEAEGYEVQPFVIPACGVNAPHRRYRTWFVARFMENSGSLGCCGQEFLRQQPGRTATVGTSAIRIPREWEAMEGNVAHRSDARLEDVQRKRQNTVLSSGITSDTTHKRSQAARLAPRYDEKKRMHSKRQIEQYSYDTRGALPIKTWQDFPTQSPVCSRNDGLSYRLDGITFPKWRKESIKAYGNAIVPQVAYRIFETINEYENYHAEQIFKIV